MYTQTAAATCVISCTPTFGQFQQYSYYREWFRTESWAHLYSSSLQ